MNFINANTILGSDCPISKITADAFEDLVWSGNEEGYICSRFTQTLGKYTSFRAHSDKVLDLALVDAGIYSISASSLRLTHRRGLIKWCLKSEENSSFTAMAVNMNSDCVVADDQIGLQQFNCARGRLIKKQNSENKYSKLNVGRFLICATKLGNIELRDPKNWKIEHKLMGHTGEIRDMDNSGNILMTCGLSKRMGHCVMDYFVKIYDLRMIRESPPIPVSTGPSFVKFHPKSPNYIFSLSDTGQIQLSNLHDPNDIKFYQMEMADYCKSFDVSATGQMIFLGDNSGIIQLWIDGNHASQNINSRPIELPSVIVPNMEISLNDNVPLSSIGMPHYKEKLLSAWLPHNPILFPQKPTCIPKDILDSMKTVDFVGYAPNTGKYKRNFNLYDANEFQNEFEVPKFRSEQAREKFFGAKSITKKPSNDQLSASPISFGSAIPRHYRLIEIKYSKFGVEDFDFGFYNKTEFSGLETHIANSYCNSLIQILFFNDELREILKTHIKLTCTKDFCLSCELGFLFRMLEDGKGLNCQATNFLRAFSMIKQAGALGLFEHEDVAKLSKKDSLLLKIQTFNRFILEHINQELGSSFNSLVFSDQNSDSSVMQHIFGVPTESASTCIKCSQSIKRNISPFVIDLNYNKEPAPFAEILKNSLEKSIKTKAWCDKCKKYQMISQTRKLSKFPNIIDINVNALTSDETNMWISEESKSAINLPLRMSLELNETNELIIKDLNEEEFTPENDKTAIYYLTSSIVEIRHEIEKPHLVAHIKNGDWYLFNDFLVQSSSETEAIDFRSWKSPAIVQYRKKDFKSKIQFNEISDESGLLNEMKKIKTGEIFAIDAEFVAVTKEEIEIHADGSKTVIRPSVLTLARVSVLGDDGSVLIDDYAIPSEPIVDYLTEFSGIRAEDLDPKRSKHNLLPLKTIYKKLRILIDQGCKFVGHGLLKDFRIINILVPQDQIIDTVNIYHIENKQRKLSLRFLSWYILNTEIQSQEHDSIEDAKMALRLYKTFVRLEKDGKFSKVLSELYEEGSKYQWRSQSSPSSFFENYSNYLQ